MYGRFFFFEFLSFVRVKTGQDCTWPSCAAYCAPQLGASDSSATACARNCASLQRGPGQGSHARNCAPRCAKTNQYWTGFHERLHIVLGFPLFSATDAGFSPPGPALRQEPNAKRTPNVLRPQRDYSRMYGRYLLHCFDHAHQNCVLSQR